MDEDDIRVNWRAAIWQDSSRQVVHGRLQRLGRRRVVVGAESSMQPGHRCNLALMLPKSSPDQPDRIVEGRGVVAHTVMSAMQFHITLERIELDGNGEALVNENLRVFGKTWRQ